jgi:antitoxin (DNA-binding transcriptional repressor) of toxin-antitoxin stability system
MALVERGETVEITKNGRVIGRIVPASSGELDDLVAAGWVTPPTLRGPIPLPPGEIDHGNSTSEALIAMRDEEPW